MSLRYLAFGFAILIAGCVSVPNQAYNKGAGGTIKKIGVVKVSDPAEYSVMLVHHPGLGFGLVGGLVAVADVSSKSKTFTQQQVDKYVRLGPDLTDALTNALSSEGGFEVVVVDGGTQPRSEFLKDYPAADCDAYLDARIQTAGYWAQFVSTPYLPTLFVPVRLVDAHSKTVLYTATVFVTDGEVPKGGEQIYPETAYSFQDFGALKADPDGASEGLRRATQIAAEQIAKDMK